MKLRYKIHGALIDSWLWVEWKLLKFLSFILPTSKANDPDECKHKWYVDSYDYENVAINVMCFGCSSNGIVKNPTEEEWMDVFGENMKKWTGQSEVTWLFQWDE